MSLVNPNLTKDVSHFFQRGSTPLEIWYTSMFTNSGMTTGAQAIDLLRACPFFSGPGGQIDRLSFEVTTAAAVGGVGRCGIYEARGESDIYPGDLAVDSGEFDTTVAGVKTATVSVYLKPNTLYWFAQTFGVAAPQVRLNNPTHCPQVMGFSPALGSAVRAGITQARAYAALPATYPAGAAFATGGTGLCWVRWAAV